MGDAAEKEDVCFESFLFCFSRGEEKRTSRGKWFHFFFFQLTFVSLFFFFRAFCCFFVFSCCCCCCYSACFGVSVCVCVCVLRCLTACIFPEKKYESTYPVYLPLLLCSDFISIQEALCLIFFINICFFFFSLFICMCHDCELQVSV